MLRLVSFAVCVTEPSLSSRALPASSIRRVISCAGASLIFLEVWISFRLMGEKDLWFKFHFDLKV